MAQQNAHRPEYSTGLFPLYLDLGLLVDTLNHLGFPQTAHLAAQARRHLVLEACLGDASVHAVPGLAPDWTTRRQGETPDAKGV